MDEYRRNVLLSCAELAHKWHTRPLPRGCGFGLGAATNKSLAQMILRWHFLETAREKYPALEADLRELAARLGPDASMSYWGLNADRRAAVDDFCRKWGLTYGRDPAGWAREVVSGACQIYCIFGFVSWYTPAGYTRDADSTAWDPYWMTYASAKAQTPRRAWPALREILRRELTAGAVRRTRYPNPAALTWAVEHYVGGRTYEQIAFEPGCRATWETVKSEITELARLIGLRRPPGRPRKHHSSN